MIPKPDKPPDLPSSYRPISLLPFLGKILERLIFKRILLYISTNKILPDSQFGFRSAHNTIHQVHRLVDAISCSLENKHYCTCAFLDISQAFDRVWYEGLLFKLKKFLSPCLFLLIKSYISDRHFQIRFGSSVSKIEKILAGVPQGGILSPFLLISTLLISLSPRTLLELITRMTKPSYHLIKTLLRPRQIFKLIST